jgi:uncharacterized tellurite resistance protein B-like protein
MEMNEIYLKTAFCCMACDGDIANEEVLMLKRYISDHGDKFKGIDVESLLNSYVEGINTMGERFLKNYLAEIAECNLSEEEQLNVISLAINIIEADEKIEYSEIAFFKKIRLKLSISDDKILSQLPEKEDYLLPDIIDDNPFEWLPVSFNSIVIS